ncbi:Blue copper protein [Ananas comosus]|nr:Blue copper protein [Ananas comosus]
MAVTSVHTIQTAFLVTIFLLIRPSLAHNHIVGGSIWSIPLAADLYGNWAHNISFEVGDTLVFRFEMGLYDVVEVSQSEFEHCTAEKPFRAFLVGPAELHLDEGGMRYFICSVGNYCFLGMKLPVSVQSLQPPPPGGSSSPIPSPVP